ncbi:alpha-ribazole phosphatase [Draconibacterium halophilum]|uniref:Alpha-ribazole phosphatase n=1 Tax=Draconibacterium halophilum TaxID=2706887 RepID=A0A6C0RG76_9BACT|nr:alpha-ribazole phosphatase [Draconibacterium halophilum]QIA08996.1 alpha-ribazole phosphatase [Draconibacterium halophilum]
MNIYAIRHTRVNVKAGICYGQTDVDVAGSFYEEQKKLAQEIKSVNFDQIWSSPLIRCRKLTESLFVQTDIKYDSRLKELNFGDWEMQSWDDIYAGREGKCWMNNYKIQATKNGESYPEMMKRVSAFINEIKKYNTKNIAVVTHAGVIRILKSVIEGVPIGDLFENFKPPYGSVTILEIKKHE